MPRIAPSSRTFASAIPSQSCVASQYYHYATGNKSETYEEVLPKVKAYHDNLGVPFRHWQFDSWFYPKDGGVGPGGGGGAVTNWTAMPSVFPSG
eukprot:219909-Prymnesium_polylepis.2